MNDRIFESIVAVIGAALCYTFGEVDGLFQALIAMVALDYVTGILKGGKRGELSSAVGFEGIRRKVMIFMLVGAAHILDHELVNELLGSSEVLRDLVIFFYLANEGLSIIENAIAIGLPIPEVVKERLKEFVERGKVEGERKESA